MGDENASFAPDPNNNPEEDNYYNMSNVIWYRPGAEVSSNTPFRIAQLTFRIAQLTFRIAQLTFKKTANGTLTYKYADSDSIEYQLYNLGIVNGVIRYNY